MGKFRVANRITHSEKVLNMMVEANMLSEKGKNSVIQALDPMHDLPVSVLSGWPDMETSASVVQCIKKTIAITTNQSSTDNWDCHFCVLPFANNVNFTPTLSRTNNFVNNFRTLTDPQTTNNTIGGVTVWGEPVGGSTVITDTPIATVVLDDTYIHGPSRIVGMGFEVNNTTADLYKQGQVIVYRLPQPDPETSDYTVISAASWNSGVTTVGSYQQFRPPCNTAANAMLLAGSRQWSAKDGVYMVVPLINGPDNPALVGDYNQPMFPVTALSEDQPDGDQSGPINNGAVVIPTLFVVPIETEVGFSNCSVLPCNRIYPLQQCGAIFTGLSPQTSLQLTVNFYLETFPGFAENTLLTLATPSTHYDPLALQMISRAFLDMPVAFRFGDNGLGQAFAETIADMADFIAPIALAVGHPEIAAIVTGGGKIARVAAGYLATPSPQENKAVVARAGPPPLPPRSMQPLPRGPPPRLPKPGPANFGSDAEYQRFLAKRARKKAKKKAKKQRNLQR